MDIVVTPTATQAITVSETGAITLTTTTPTPITLTISTGGSSGSGIGTIEGIAAGGDLQGTYASPTVHRVHGNDFQPGTPTNLDVFQWNGTSNDWKHVSLATAGIAAASHNHAASAITSGTISTLRLGSGASSASNFLRGDQTWAVPSLTLTEDSVTSFALADNSVDTAAIIALNVTGAKIAASTIDPTTKLTTTGTPTVNNYLCGNNTWSVPFSIPKFIPYATGVVGTGMDAGGIMNDAYTTVSGLALGNTQTLYPFVAAFSYTPNLIGAHVSTAGVGSPTCNIQVAIYASDPATGHPIGAPLNTPSSISVMSTGDKTSAYTTAVVAGCQYWLGMQMSGSPGTTNPIYRAIAGASLIPLVQKSDQSNQLNIIQHAVTYGTWRNYTTTPLTAANISTEIVNGTPPLVYLVRNT
jgi:hypothetical protein